MKDILLALIDLVLGYGILFAYIAVLVSICGAIQFVIDTVSTRRARRIGGAR